MANPYYDAADLRKFGSITEWSKELGDKFLIIMVQCSRKGHSLHERNH